MKYAIISDTHANMDALTVCLRKIDKIKPDRIICLGDLIDYCAHPNECTELVKNNCDVVILGNHDEAQFRYSLSGGFSENAYISSVHTRDIINSEYIEYFKTLPYTHSENNLFFVHGSPYLFKQYDYCETLESAALNFKHFKDAVCFIGHSHIPVIFEKNNKNVRVVRENQITKSNKYIINPGSVGQPRDGNPKLSFGIFDTEEFIYKNIRLDYDIESAAKKIIHEGLPLRLAERLFQGT